MGAPALATITVTDPLVAIAVGLLWLGEQIQTSPWRILGEMLSLAVLVAGVYLLARRAPQVSNAVRRKSAERPSAARARPTRRISRFWRRFRR